MNDLVRVHVKAGADELDHEKASFGLGETAPPTQEVHEGARGTQRERDVDVVVVFEAILKVDDVGV